ncbi:MAG: pyridoxal-phosphate dependent enzyme [Anaerolineales bacterium]|nr:pyridoxal-phosphate dependent enzyme [Anaerolineales bacterium]
MMIPPSWFEDATERIRPYIHQTPLTIDEVNFPYHNRLYIKWENKQVTGSFKARGALNKVLCLAEWERERGLVTASAGNHGQGVALAGQICQAKVLVFASDHATEQKISAMRNLGAEVRLVPGGYGEAEKAALGYATETGSTWVSPYNDGQVIAGQGSLALEIRAQLADAFLPGGARPEPEIWVVPAGGGGLVSGVGSVLKQSGSHIKLIAVQSEASPFLHDLYYHGSQDHSVELPSLADGLAGPVEPGSVTIPLTKQVVDDFVLVSEDEIACAIAFAWQHYAERIEGSAATALAAVLSGKIPQVPALVVLTGGNIQPEIHQRIVQHALATE